MSEDKKKSPKRASRQRGLFSGPADPLMGGMGAPPRPKRKKKPAPKAKPASVSPPPLTVPLPPEQRPVSEPTTASAPTTAQVSAPTSEPAVLPAPEPALESPQSKAAPEPAPTPAPSPEPAPQAAPEPERPAPVLPPRPAGISLSDTPSPPAEPQLSDFPASMRLRMAKAKATAEKLASPPPPPPPEPEPESPAAPLDDGRRITLPPVSERGTGPASWEQEDEGFDLLQDGSEPTGGLLGLVGEDDQDDQDDGFDAPGRPVASLNVIERQSEEYDYQAPSEQEQVDASAWNDPQTDHNAPFDIQARQTAYEEDLDEPPSELVDLDQLPRGPVIVRDEKANDGFTHRVSPRPMVEDAGVWQTTSIPPENEPGTTPVAPPSGAPRPNRAWWEERVGDENSQQGRVSPLPAAPKRKADAAPSFLGKTRQEREAEKRRRAKLIGGGISLLVLLILAIFVALSEYTPAPSSPPPQVMVPPSEPLPELPEPVVDTPDPTPVAEVPTPEPEVDPPELVPEDPVDPALLVDPGFLNIRAEPRAVIFMNGQNLGQTPLERLELPPGEHTFKAVAPGKRAQVRTVRVDSGQAQRIIFRF